MAGGPSPNDPARAGIPTPLAPLETLFDATEGDPLPLPLPLAELYGVLRFPPPAGRPRVLASFASTIDGVAAFPSPGAVGGGEVTGASPHDRMILGLLRAVADVVVVGAGTVRASPRHRWTAARAFPPLRAAYSELRERLGMPPAPLTVIVSARGDLDPTAPLFRGDEAPVLVVTTRAGAATLAGSDSERRIAVATAAGGPSIPAAEILGAIPPRPPVRRVLVEGGPHLLGEMLAARVLDELFLTVAPQVAGRDGRSDRPGIVAGHALAPDRPMWGALRSVRRAGDHLFLRYGFPGERVSPG